MVKVKGKSGRLERFPRATIIPNKIEEQWRLAPNISFAELTGGAEAVIGGALFLVSERVIGLVHFFENVLGFLAWILALFFGGAECKHKENATCFCMLSLSVIARIQTCKFY